MSCRRKGGRDGASPTDSRWTDVDEDFISDYGRRAHFGAARFGNLEKSCVRCHAGPPAGNRGDVNRASGPQDRAARFEALFRAEYPAVFGYIGRRVEPGLVDDLVDEVFLVAWRRLDKVPAEPRPWLLTVARNVLGTHIRGARRSRALNVRLAASEVDQTSPPPANGEGEVAAALEALRPKDREALLLVS